MKLFYAILCLCCFGYTHAQNLSGVWIQEHGAENARLVIIETEGHYVGYTYDEGGGSFCQANFTGSFDRSKQKLKGLNPSFINKGFGHGLSRYNLNYVTGADGQEYLSGTLHPKTVAMQILSFGMPRFIRYKKINELADTTAFMLSKITAATDTTAWTFQPQMPSIHSDTITSFTITPPVAVNPVIQEIAEAKNSRTADTLTTIRTKANTITIKIMDNGVIDGDTISILHNGRPLATQMGVKLEPYIFTLDIAGDAVHEITMIAHNLGAIPPNTALVIIEAGEKTYRLTASTDMQRNSVLLVLHDKQAPQ